MSYRRIKKPCPYCGDLYYPLGIMRHRLSARCRDNYIRKYHKEPGWSVRP